MNDGAREENAARARQAQVFDARTAEMTQRDMLKKLDRMIELLEQIEANTRRVREERKP